VTLAQRINLTACLLTPYPHRVQVAEAAKQYPTQIVPFGFVDLDASDVLSQVKDFHALGYRGLGELEFGTKPYVDASHLPVYELANQYGWVLLFHTGIVLGRSVDQPENVASYRMRGVSLGGDCTPVSEADCYRGSLRQSRIRMGRRSCLFFGLAFQMATHGRYFH
jgi:hypothetical protein